MTKLPFPWLKQIAPEIAALDAVPLFGPSPPFDWHRFASLAASRFGVKELDIQPGEQMWRPEQEWKKGLGPNLMTIPVTAAPIQSGVFWIMSRKDIAKITSWMMSGKARVQSLSSEALQEGFYKYLLLETLDALQGLSPLKELTLQLGEEDSFSGKNAFCIDVQIAFDGHSCWGRLAVPSEFQKSWMEHFKKNPVESVSPELARQIPLHLGVQVGSVTLHPQEWKKVKEGDFIALDRSSYDARKETGTALFILGSTPLFNVRIKQNKIEFLDYAFYYEEKMENKGHAPKETAAPSEEEVVSLKELPLNISVELARLKISLEKLMHLTPGNFLELPIHPDQPVSLTVNGQLIGRAELVQIGETLGLRILTLG